MPDILVFRPKSVCVMWHGLSWYPIWLYMSSRSVHQPHLGSAAQSHLTWSQAEPYKLAVSYFFLPDWTPEYVFVTVNKPKARGREVDYLGPVLSPNLQSPEHSCAWFYVMLCLRMFLVSQACMNQGNKVLSACLAFWANVLVYGHALGGLETPSADLFLPVLTGSDTNCVVSEQFVNNW